MKQLIFLISLLISVGVYSQKHIAIKGSYASSPFVIKSKLSIDSAMDKILDYLIFNGVSLKITDKANHLFLSERVKLKWTTEIGKKPILNDTSALIVVPQLYRPGPNKYSPIIEHSDVTGELNIRLKLIDDITVVTINYVNLKYQVRDKYYRTYRDEYLSDFKSTGKLEYGINEMLSL